MERIAPLAKILAEANGIEWEALPGTGPGGQIVEQDILDYLTRVMSGEAEPPSTPVDAPPPDWNGEDLPGAGMFDAAALSKAGVESDIAEFVSQGRPAGPQIPGTAAPALETSDFELDDSDSQEDLLAPPAEVPAPAPVVPVAEKPAPVMAEAAVPAPQIPAVAPVAAAATAGGLGSLLSRLYHKDEPAPVVAAPAAEPVHTEPVRTEPLHVEPVHTAPEAAQVEAPAPVVETPAPVIAEVEQPKAAVPVVDEILSEPAPSHEPEAAQAVVESPAVEAVQPEAPATTVPVHAPEPAVVPAASQPVQEIPGQLPREAVWFGTYLRRDANLGTLSDLRIQLGEALERDVPLALLVARAAQRHAGLLGLNTVAMQDIGANSARSVGTGHSTGIREAVAALESHYEGTPDLLVVDAGHLDLDDLHYPHTLTLSVGRVQGDKATLSLQGDVETAKAAQFLANVASTLEKPVILLV